MTTSPGDERVLTPFTAVLFLPLLSPLGTV